MSENPFDSDRKLMSTLTQYGQDNYRVHTKGALDNLLRISTSALVNGKVVPLTDEMKAEYLRVSEDLPTMPCVFSALRIKIPLLL